MELTTTVVTATPSIETVIFGDPAPALARIVNAVETGTVTVVEAVPGPLNANADLPEALRSETTRPEPVIFSASTTGTGVLAAAVATGTIVPVAV